MMRIIITGAQFGNKGAQAMLFVAVDELKKKFQDCEIFFATDETIDCSKLNMKTVFYTYDLQRLILGNLNLFKFSRKCIKQAARFVLGRRAKKIWHFGCVKELKKLLLSTDMIIDVSGFNLGEQWPEWINEWFLNHIRLAKKFNIPIYLMPQSFGPFCYSDYDERTRKRLLAEIEETLQYPRIIFPREREGYEMLEAFGLNNLTLSTDTVLQNKGVNFENIYTSDVEFNIPAINIKGNVAIIPNSQCFSRIEAEALLSIYDILIRISLDEGKTVYVFRHCNEDQNVCKQIKARFAKEKRVILLENDFSCFEYDALVMNFDFIICSRYHGIVHALRNGVPAIALGWAVKYKELLHNVGQDRYEFDITSKNFNVHDVEAALKEMLAGYEQESECIKTRVEEIQKENCYDLVVKDFATLCQNKNV